MKNFMDENFLLQTETAQKLYHEHAAKMPIIDYHCHLIPQMVADDYQFKSLTEIWLGGDHYKWRAMRTNGVDERFCTGKDTTDWEKFEKWAETVPYTFRNPLYHWTHLELKTAFGIDKILNPKTAREIYDECNEKLKQPEYSARGMMRRYHVETVCTTDDPIDSLEYHIKTRESGFEIKMLPTWRPDKAMAVEVPGDFRAYVEKLAEVSGVTISTFDDMIAALRKRHDFFAAQGCKLSDHGIEEFYAEDYTDAEIKAIFNKVYGGTALTKEEMNSFHSRKFFPREIKLATDGLALIVNRANPDSLLSVRDFRRILTGEVKNWKEVNPDSRLKGIQVVFDNKNSSTVRFAMDSICGGKPLAEGNVSALKTNQQVIDYVVKNPDAMGVIGVNWLGNRSDTTNLSFREEIRVMAVSAEDVATPANSYKPYQAYLFYGNYPLARSIYALLNDPRSGLPWGFASFMTSDKGQRIILKSGLVPATQPVRIVHVKDE
jgi:hypothetical protein